MSAPFFGLQDGGVVLLTCKLEIMDKDTCIVAINTREKTLKDLAFSTGRTYYFSQTYSPYALSKHMDMTALNDSGTSSLLLVSYDCIVSTGFFCYLVLHNVLHVDPSRANSYSTVSCRVSTSDCKLSFFLVHLYMLL